jgi:hypothetical protein
MKKLIYGALALSLFITACDKIENEADSTTIDTTATEVAFVAVAGEDNVIDLRALFVGSKANTAYQFNTKTANGTLELLNNEYVKYTPNDDVTFGEDKIEIRNGEGGYRIVNISINGGEGDKFGAQKCGARADRFIVLSNAPTAVFNVLKNDNICKVVDTTTLKILAAPTNGVGAVKGSKLQYTPNKDYIGQDFMVYEVSSKDSIPKKYIAFVAIGVVKKADPGTGGTGGPNCTTILVNDAVTIKAGTVPSAAVLSVLKNDKICDDYKNIIPTIAIAPKNGKAVVNTNSTISYTPNAAYKGTDTLEYQLTNAAGASVKARVKIIIFTENNNGGGGTVTCVPLVAPDKSDTKPEKAVTIDVTKNDKICDLTGLEVTAAPTKGIAVVNGSKIIYTPNKGVSNTTDNFVYALTDAKGNKFSAVVLVSITK